VLVLELEVLVVADAYIIFFKIHVPSYIFQLWCIIVQLQVAMIRQWVCSCEIICQYLLYDIL
jgi:hypothetical protein